MKKEHQEESLWLPGKHSSVIHKVAPPHTVRTKQKGLTPCKNEQRPFCLGDGGVLELIKRGQVGVGGLENSAWHNKWVCEDI